MNEWRIKAYGPIAEQFVARAPLAHARLVQKREPCALSVLV
jgi:hypothetical protein